MTTVGARGALAAAMIFAAGLAYFGRKPFGSRVQILGLLGTVALTVIVGWLAWYSSIQTAT
jgi:hypothetical protein